MPETNINTQLIKDDFEKWVSIHYFQLAIFNIILIILTLLRSAGYFEPFFPITINMIVFISLMMMIFLLKMGSRFLFTLALIFWIFAEIFQLLQILVWSERAAIYAFDAISIGIVQVIFETIFKKDSF